MGHKFIELSEIPKHFDITHVPQPQLSTILYQGIEYDNFFRNALLANQLFLIKSVSNGWKSQKEWVTEGRPNFEVLEGQYGELEVPVALCNERYFNAQSKKSMIFKEYIAYFKDHVAEGYPPDDCLYLKDWHLARQCPSDNFYEVPEVFASDWLNEYLVEGNSNADDYRFVYLGPKGSCWSVNLCGKKKWVFYPPGEENQLKNIYNELVYDVNSEELLNSQKYPKFSNSLSHITVIQEQGDAIFVPSGWHHQVWNLDDTISINHNWINACNVRHAWRAMLECFKSVQREIESCRDMDNYEEHCQLMLKTCFGMDFDGFLDMLCYVGDARLEMLKKDRALRVFGWEFGPCHMRYDVKVLLEVMNDMTDVIEARTDRLKRFIDRLIEISV